MSFCGFKNLVSTPCGPRKYPKHSKESVIIRNCCNDIKGHLRSLNTFDLGLKSEGKLILARAGKSLSLYTILYYTILFTKCRQYFFGFLGLNPNV